MKIPYFIQNAFGRKRIIGDNVSPLPCENEQQMQALFDSLPPKKIDEASHALQLALGPQDWAKINIAIDTFGTEWLGHLYDDVIAQEETRFGKEAFAESGMAAFFAGRGHFGFGMEIRNRLRLEGFDEKFFGIANLDDIYVFLLERAAAAERVKPEIEKLMIQAREPKAA